MLAATTLILALLVGAAGPSVFEPGVVSGPAGDAAISLRADGQELFFERGAGPRSIIMTTHRQNGRWVKPTVAPFSGRWLDLEPALAPDGSYLIFVSNRPDPGGSTAIDGVYFGKVQVGKGGRLWRVDRTPTGWSAPRLLPTTVNAGNAQYEPVVATNGDLYFQRADADGARFQLYRAPVKEREGYDEAVALSLGAQAGQSDMDPAVARDGSYLVFASDRLGKPNRLFIAFRHGEDWSAPVPLDEGFNGAGSVGDPRIGPEPDRLYFTSGRLAPWSGDPVRDLAAAEGWNNGGANIWSAPFDASEYQRSRG